MASDVCQVLEKLRYDKVFSAGHDIEAMVAFSFTENYPPSVKKLILIDGLHPEESLKSLTLVPAYNTFDKSDKINPLFPCLWWFAFH